jgi:DNA-binding transcriptional MerR regulator
MKRRPIDIARKLHISTSALRNYEAQGIVPPTKRLSNGYRIYTEEHIAYFECIQAMAPGFGMEVTSEVLRKIQLNDIHAAFWLVKEKEASLYRDKKVTESTLQILQSQKCDLSKENEWMTIGEVSEQTRIPRTAIRHWEKIGLITASRDMANGYRKFNGSQLRKILLIRSLRTSVYSLDVVHLKQAIEELDHDNVENAITIAIDTLKYLDKISEVQLRGAHYLYTLCRLLNLLE